MSTPVSSSDSVYHIDQCGSHTPQLTIVYLKSGLSELEWVLSVKYVLDFEYLYEKKECKQSQYLSG